MVYTIFKCYFHLFIGDFCVVSMFYFIGLFVQSILHLFWVRCVCNFLLQVLENDSYLGFFWWKYFYKLANYESQGASSKKSSFHNDHFLLIPLLISPIPESNWSKGWIQSLSQSTLPPIDL